MDYTTSLIYGTGIPTVQEVPGAGTNGNTRPEVGPSKQLRDDGRGRFAVTFASSGMMWDGQNWTPPRRQDPFTYRLMDLNPTLARARVTRSYSRR